MPGIALPGGEPQLPYVLGSEGAGTVVAVGENVSRFQEGDRVYGLITARNSKGGFYAEAHHVLDTHFLGRLALRSS